jgi:hypothetical protein
MSNCKCGGQGFQIPSSKQVPKPYDNYSGFASVIQGKQNVLLKENYTLQYLVLGGMIVTIFMLLSKK